jgi:hypothetical protein
MRRHLLLRALAWLTACSFIAACAGAPAQKATYPASSPPLDSAPVAAEPGAKGEATAPAMAHVAARTPSPAPQNAKTTQTSADKPAPEATVASALVIYTGNVAMMEDEEKIPALIDKIIDTGESFGGRLHARRDDGVTIRVPSAHFRAAMTKIDALGAVTHRSVKAEDVSEEYHDAEVRLLNLKATRQRLQEFFARAQNMQEALAIEHELERVSQEIDRLQGRLRFLQERAALSIIDVSIAAKPKPRAPIVTPPPVMMPPSPKGIELPIDWLDRLGAQNLSNLK